jgi:hypothetical protein
MLAPTLRRHRRHRAFEDLQKRLLHAFPRHVTVIDGFSALRAILSISSM